MKVQLSDAARRGDDYVVPVVFPNGKTLDVLIPDFDVSHIWAEPEDGAEYGLNLVTEGHYS